MKDCSAYEACRRVLRNPELAAVLAIVAHGHLRSVPPLAVATLVSWRLVEASGDPPQLTSLGRKVAYHLGEYGTQIEQGGALGLAALLNIVPESLVLDLGCGAGQTLAALASAAPRLAVGVEYNPVALTIFSAVKDYAGLRSMVAVQGNAEMLPFHDCTFDYVLCRVMLMFVRVPVVLREVARVTRPGGRVYLHLTDVWFYLRKLLRGQLERGGVPFALVNGALLNTLGVQFGTRPDRRMNFQTIAGVRRQLHTFGFEVENVITHRDNPFGATHVQPKIIARRL